MLMALGRCYGLFSESVTSWNDTGQCCHRRMILFRIFIFLVSLCIFYFFVFCLKAKSYVFNFHDREISSSACVSEMTFWPLTPQRSVSNSTFSRFVYYTVSRKKKKMFPTRNLLLACEWVSRRVLKLSNITDPRLLYNCDAACMRRDHRV
jgi:hypothetical protein